MSCRLVIALRRTLRRRLPGSRPSASARPSRGRLPETIYPDDTFLVSYPRSGSAWLRRLIASVQDPTRQIDVAHIEQWVPDIYAAGAALEHCARPRIMKSHEPFDAAYPRVIHLVRDGRDVAVSYYHFSQTLHGFPGSFAEFLERFLSGADLQFGAWARHVESWLPGAAGPSQLLVRYEDLHADTECMLGRIAGFFGWQPSPAQISHAIEACGFERHRADLRRLKRPGGYEGGVRAAPGAWRNLFTAEQLKTFWARAGGTMRKLGYGEPESVTSHAGR